MYQLEDIRHVHLEISSRCNASCPLCPRNLHGYPYNDGYVEKDLTLQEVKKIFPIKFVKQLNNLLINGNFGDIVMNPESVDIIKYFRTHNPNLLIDISTNGGARNKQFWKDLAALKCTVWFCIDGLEDTNHLYRQNVVWKTVIDNAKHFIQHSGVAIWQMIDFDFNQHQQQFAQDLAKILGFSKFRIMNEGRQNTPVFNKQGQLTYVIGNTDQVDFKKIIWLRQNADVLYEDIEPRSINVINCYAKKNSSIFVSSTGDVYPCCHTGMQPDKYGHGDYMQVVNSQLKKIIKANNAIDQSLEKCIQWFDQVEKTWTNNDFNSGRLVVCQDKCGTIWRNNTHIDL
jgi:MoaA/NifB/PqqE/SkfB family radical SAM enzyme